MTTFAHHHLKIDTSTNSLPGPFSDRMQVTTTYSPNSLRPYNLTRLRSSSNASTSSSISFVSPTPSSSANDSAVSLVPQSAGSSFKSPIPSPISATFDDANATMPEYVLAMHDYEPQHNASTCLSFRAGQVIHVLNRDASGWWDGELEGRRGWFPSNYVNTDLNPMEQTEPIRKRMHAYSKSLSNPHTTTEFGHSKRPSDLESHVPAVMVPLSHGLSLLQNAVYSNRTTHFQPSTACIISCVRGVLTATETLLRDAPILRQYPVLADERRLILSTLASLVAQAKRASEDSLDEASLELEADAMLRLGQQVFALVRRFLAIAVQCGVELPERRDPSSSLPTSFSGTTLAGETSWSNDDTVTLPSSSSQIPTSPIGRTPTKSRLLARPGTPGANRARSTGDLRSLAKSQMGGTTAADIPAVPPLPKTTVAELRDRLSKKHKPELSVSSASSSSSYSSLESAPTRPAFPHGPCTMAQVMEALRSTHDHYLSAVAAFVGHAHSHSRTSHASSTGHMYDLVREIVEMSCKLLTIVESVLSHPDVPMTKLTALKSAKQGQYNATSELAEAVRMISVPLPLTMTEEQEKQLLLRCATAALKAGADLAVAVKVCLNRSLGERPFILEIPSTAGSSPTSYHAPGFIKSMSMTSLGRYNDDDMDEGDITVHELAGDEDPTTTIKPIPIRFNVNERSSGSESSDSISKSSSRSGDTDVTSPDDTKSTKSHKSLGALILSRGPVDPDLASPSSVIQTEEDGTTWEGSTRNFPLSALEEKMLNGDLPVPPEPLHPIPELAADPAGYMFSHDYAADDIAYNTEGVLVGATLLALVEKLTPHDVVVDPAFSAVFFMTFRMFCSPVELAETFVIRYHLSPPPGLSEADLAGWMQRKGIPVRLRVSNAIKLWLDVYWKGNCDFPALPILASLTNEISTTFSKPAERIIELIRARTDNEDMALSPKGDTRTRDPGISLNPPTVVLTSEVPRPTMTKTLLAALRSRNYTSISITDFDALELARQLTIMESNLYCAITPEEMLESGQEAPGIGATTRRPVNVKAVSSLSTVITGWVAESILDEGDMKKRTALVKFFLKVADKCVSLHNYSTFRSILAALDSSTISRLQQTWTGLPQKSKLQLESLRRLADHGRNYREYRAKLRNTAPPAVPFLGLYLTDITFCREGNPSHRASPLNANKKLLNFNKYHKLARIVQDMQRFQVPYNLKIIPEVQDFLNFIFSKSQKGDLQDLYRRSLLVEPKQPADAPPSAAPTGDMRQLFNWASRSQTIGPNTNVP